MTGWTLMTRSSLRQGWTKVGALGALLAFLVLATGAGLWLGGQRAGVGSQDEMTPSDSTSHSDSVTSGNATRDNHSSDAAKREGNTAISSGKATGTRDERRVSRLQERAAALKGTPEVDHVRSLAEAGARVEYVSSQLGLVEEPALQALLLAAAADPSRDVRIEAVLGLGVSNDPEFREPVLLDLLQDEDEVVRDLAFHKVEEMEVGERVRLLSEVLNAENRETSRRAADTIAMLKTRSGVDALLGQAATTSDSGESQRMVHEVGRSLDRQFDSLDAAQSWWGQNREGLTEELTPVPLAQP